MSGTLPLPPLAALRAFEAAARLGSFTKAGEELGMTQAAVSYQIKALEDRVGAPLFERRPRQVTLTETGRAFAPAIAEAFERIAAAFAEARGLVRDTLTLSVVPTIATNWLAQNLGHFQVTQPNLAVRLDSTAALVDLRGGDADVGIRGGYGDWPDLEAILLLKARFSPMLSPRLAETIGGVKEPADLLRLPLLEPDDAWWTGWLGGMGVAFSPAETKPSVLLGSQIFVARSAIAGNGVAVLTPELYGSEVEHGLLFQPFPQTFTDGLGYWLIYPKGRGNVPKIRAFREWVLEATRDWRKNDG